MAASSVDSKRACEIATEMILSDDFQFRQSGDDVVQSLAQRFPEQTIDAIGARMLDDKTRTQFFYRKFPVLATLPAKVVSSWLEKVGVKGAQAIARHLQPPFLDDSGEPRVPALTEYVLTQFEDDQRTFTEFVAGIHSYQGYWGSYATARLREGDEAKAFLNSSVNRIREWAQIEIRRAEEEAEIFRIQEEEQGLG